MNTIARLSVYASTDVNKSCKAENARIIIDISPRTDKIYQPENAKRESRPINRKTSAERRC